MPVEITTPETPQPIPGPVVAPYEGDDEAPIPAKPAEPAPKPKPAPDDREELASLRRQLSEAQASERYWADRARGGKEPEPIEEPEVGLDDLAEPPEAGESPTPEKFLDALNEKGADAIIEELKRRGLVFDKQEVLKLSAETSRRIVQHERGKMTIDAQLVSEFPELKDDSSELFAKTREILKASVALDPALAKSPAALLMAARQAKAELRPAAKPRRTDYREEGDSDIENVNRKRRIESQMGDLGRGSGAPFEGDDDDFGPEARQVVALFGRAGVTEKDYRAERARQRGQR